MRSFFTCLLLIFFITSVKAQQSEFPQPAPGYVHDYENIFTAEQFVDISRVISKIKKEKKKRIIVISIDSIGSYSDFNKFAIDLSDYWGKERSKFHEDITVTIIFSKSLRQVRISTTDDIRDKINDQLGQEIIDNILIPSFRKDDYYNGIKNSILALEEKLKQ